MEEMQMTGTYGLGRRLDFLPKAVVRSKFDGRIFHTGEQALRENYPLGQLEMAVHTKRVGPGQPRRVWGNSKWTGQPYTSGLVVSERMVTTWVDVLTGKSRRVVVVGECEVLA
jgi:hypothetical protein